MDEVSSMLADGREITKGSIIIMTVKVAEIIKMESSFSGTEAKEEKRASLAKGKSGEEGLYPGPFRK